ncbi:bifunctional diguanylate cyclase/phosphodiesterase [Actinoplanes sp. NPDC051861]|uniref:putative bifunctional diguanylate cyclase/phosphodiesterase n=1 Tax=Actinoplanes sp. NPDC051861 TaxID=3155170 RepID=UPI0034370D54
MRNLWGPPWRERAPRWLLGVVVLLHTAVCVLADLGQVSQDSVFAQAVGGAAYLLPGLLVATCARRTPALSLLAAGMLAFAAGEFYWTLFVQQLSPEPLVTPADGLWLVFYPCFAGALVLLLRRRLPRLSMPAWLDGVIAAGAVSSLVSVPVLAAVEPAPHATVVGILVNAAYPVADIAVAGCLLGAWALAGWRADRVFQLLMTGMGLFAVADVVYMVLLWQAVATPASLELMWTYGLALMALAAGRAHRIPHPGGRRSGVWVSTAIPSGLALISLGLLLYAAIAEHAVEPISSLLAAVAITAAIVRMMVSVRAAAALGAARRQARTDELTGLANRRLFIERLDEQLDGDSCGVAVAFVDLDRFKEVNDSFGHDVGDSLLRLVGARMSDSIDKPVMLARLGGDEFGLIMPGMGREEAGEVVGAVLRTLREPFALPEVDLHVDASIGIAVCPDDGTDRSTLLRRADVAMYAAKTGHGGPAFATGLDDHARARLTMLEELRAGLGRDELVLHYQPKVTADPSRRVCGVEALVRWQHPARGLVYPDAFLYTAESADLMNRITAIVLDLACRQIRTWHDDGLPVSVAVNLSVSNLRDPSFPAQVAALLGRYGLPAHTLELEVTESVLMTDADTALAQLSALREMGIRLALDDYGTGYSSLSYLRVLPVDDLKLDRSFVSRCTTDPRSAAIVHSTIQLAHRLGMSVVAEGVEDLEILDRLQGYGCDLAQGYGIARPHDAATTTRWLREQALISVAAD